MVSNNILTILLLFVLGYIIYFLTRPSGYDNVPCKKMNYVNNNYAEYENFTTDAKVSDPLVNSIMEKQATQINTQPDNYIDTVKPTNIVLNANQSDMFNYEYRRQRFRRKNERRNRTYCPPIVGRPYGYDYNVSNN